MPTLNCPLGSVLGCGVQITVYSFTSQESCRLQISNFSPLFVPCSKWQLENRQGRAALTSFCVPENLCSSVQSCPSCWALSQGLSCHICTPQLVRAGVTHPERKERNSSTNPILVVPCCLRCGAELCLIADLISPWYLRNNNHTRSIWSCPGKLRDLFS